MSVPAEYLQKRHGSLSDSVTARGEDLSLPNCDAVYVVRIKPEKHISFFFRVKEKATQGISKKEAAHSYSAP
jgi:hypothetical protein